MRMGEQSTSRIMDGCLLRNRHIGHREPTQMTTESWKMLEDAAVCQTYCTTRTAAVVRTQKANHRAVAQHSVYRVDLIILHHHSKLDRTGIPAPVTDTPQLHLRLTGHRLSNQTMQIDTEDIGHRAGNPHRADAIAHHLLSMNHQVAKLAQKTHGPEEIGGSKTIIGEVLFGLLL